LNNLEDKNMLESISGFRNWQAPKRDSAEPIKVKDYAEAVKTFETDLADIKRLDSDASMVAFGKRNLFDSGPMYGFAPAQLTPTPVRAKSRFRGWAHFTALLTVLVLKLTRSLGKPPLPVPSTS
jgi:hypothetical protein